MPICLCYLSHHFLCYWFWDVLFEFCKLIFLYFCYSFFGYQFLMGIDVLFSFFTCLLDVHYVYVVHSVDYWMECYTLCCGGWFQLCEACCCRLSVYVVFQSLFAISNMCANLVNTVLNAIAVKSEELKYCPNSE